ncbi:Uncharacterised protein [Chlamydia trachomatis]|nr:Uncharacterised protein [Chlamydia trachomatis]
MVVIDVHHHTRGVQEPVGGTNIALVLGRYMVMRHGILQISRARDLPVIRIFEVALRAHQISRAQNEVSHVVLPPRSCGQNR